MDDGDGSRSPVRRRAPARGGQPLRAAVAAAAAAAILAVAVLAAALATPPASADAPAQAEPAGPVGSTAETAETAEIAGTPGSGGDSRALAWWMAGEVGVLVVGGAIWCRRSARRQAARLSPVHAEVPATSVTRSGGAGPGGAERRASPRYRL